MIPKLLCAWGGISLFLFARDVIGAVYSEPFLECYYMLSIAIFSFVLAYLVYIFTYKDS